MKFYVVFRSVMRSALVLMWWGFEYILRRWGSLAHRRRSKDLLWDFVNSYASVLLLYRYKDCKCRFRHLYYLLILLRGFPMRGSNARVTPWCDVYLDSIESSCSFKGEAVICDAVTHSNIFSRSFGIVISPPPQALLTYYYPCYPKHTNPFWILWK
jgi:hypothetical protein